jgi:two-component system response regulator VicR
MKRGASPITANQREVLVVEDEPQMRDLLTDNLEYEGYRVTAVESAEQALLEFDRHAISLLLVDVMLPGMNGFELCRHLRSRGSHVPIIVLTARSNERDRVRGLDLGADDYVSKPFSVEELMARARAQVRRDDWHVLRYLLAHRHEIVSREQLLRDVWGYNQLSVTRTVDNYIAKLRTQLEPRPHEPRYIVTVHGSGYQLMGRPPPPAETYPTYQTYPPYQTKPQSLVAVPRI